MASVTFPEALGGNGQTYTDDADPNTGLDGLGYTVRFIPCLQQAVIMGLSAQSNAQACADYVQQCQILREEVGNDRLAVAADRQHVDQQRQAVDTAAASAAQSAASVNADNIVHAPGSGLPNAAGEAYSREVVGGDGALMVQGYNGWGGGINYGANFDFLTIPYGAVGNESQSSFPANPPVDGANRYAGFKLGNTNAELLFLAATLSPGKPIYARVKSNAGWDPEYRRMLSNLDIVGSLSQSGGVPTGAIFEEDSNDFGAWTKFYCGRILFSSVITNIDINLETSPGSEILRSDNISWQLPQPVYGPISAFARISNEARTISVHIPEGTAPGLITQINNIRAYVYGDSSLGRTAVLSGWASWY